MINLLAILFADEEKAGLFDKVNPGGKIVFTIAIALVVGAICAYLVFSIIRERNRRKLEKEKSDANEMLMTKKSVTAALEDFIRVYRLTNEATVFIFELSNANELATSFGKRYETFIREKAIQNVISILPKNTLFGEYNVENDSYIILIRGNISKKRLTQFAGVLVETIERPITVPNMDVQTSYACYLGMAFYPAQAINAEDLINKADLALYMNHKTPNERFSIYSSKFDETEKQNLVYYNEIKAAIKNKEFLLYYQPIVDANKSLVGFETLIRWQHPTLGVLAPNKFLSVLDNSGDIVWVGNWSINEICVYYTANKEAFGNKDIFFSVNLSVKQLLNSNIVNDFNSTLKKFNVPAKALCIEIEEYALYEKYLTINETLEQFRKYGYRLAIDHFGVDSNNIKKLETQKPYMIKINSDAMLEAKDSFVTSQMVNVLGDTCKQLDIKICSMMIENQEMLDELKNQNAQFFQGYYISAPIDGDRAVKFAKGIKEEAPKTVEPEEKAEENKEEK